MLLYIILMMLIYNQYSRHQLLYLSKSNMEIAIRTFDTIIPDTILDRKSFEVGGHWPLWR